MWEGALAAAATVIGLVAVIVLMTVRATRNAERAALMESTVDAGMQRIRDEDRLRTDAGERARRLRRPE